MKSFIEKTNNIFYSIGKSKTIDTHLELIKSKECTEYNALFEEYKNTPSFFEEIYQNYNKTFSGEFFTPKTIVDFVVNFVGDVSDKKVIDYCSGVGTLLEAFDAKEKKGIEFKLASSEIAVHFKGLNVIKQNVFDNNEKADLIVSNPPYGLKESKEIDFLEHALINANRVVAILPMGVLFSDKNRDFRKKYIKNFTSVVALPSNTFSTTNIPVCIVEIDISKENETIDFYNLSDAFEKVGKKNIILKEYLNIKAISKSFLDRKGLYSSVSVDCLVENDYNLSPSRYVYLEVEKPIFKASDFDSSIALELRKEESDNVHFKLPSSDETLETLHLAFRDFLATHDNCFLLNKVMVKSYAFNVSSRYQEALNLEIFDKEYDKLLVELGNEIQSTNLNIEKMYYAM